MMDGGIGSIDIFREFVGFDSLIRNLPTKQADKV